MAVSLPMADKSIKTVLNSGNCPRCFVGQCKTHPLQDHGQRTKQLTSGYKSSMQRMYDNLVNPTLKQLRDDAAQPSEQATRAEAQHTAKNARSLERSGARDASPRCSRVAAHVSADASSADMRTGALVCSTNA